MIDDMGQVIQLSLFPHEEPHNEAASRIDTPAESSMARVMCCNCSGLVNLSRYLPNMGNCILKTLPHPDSVYYSATLERYCELYRPKHQSSAD